MLARKANRRCVDDRQELLEVVDEEAVEQGLVGVVERGQADMALEVIGLAPDMLQFPGDLLVERRHSRWQQTEEAKGIPLAGCEGRAFVEEWLREKRATATRNDETVGRSIGHRARRGQGRGSHGSSLRAGPDGAVDVRTT